VSGGRVVVVGAGVAGLCCAYYLRRQQFDVTVVESNRIGSGASLGNGGWLCPAQAGPLPEPGLTLYGMRALLDRDSALYFKPSELNRLAPWLLRFRTYCNERDHAHGTAAIGRLGHDVFELVEEMQADGVEFELHKQGMVYAARGAEDARNELAKLEPMRAFGYELPDEIVTGTELHELEPALSDTVNAGFLINQHWHVKPDTFTRGLADALIRDGVEITEGAEVVELVREGRRLTHVRTAAGDIAADTVVLAAGSWTTPLARSVGISLPMEPGKGYSFSVDPTVVPQHAVLLVDVHVGCTPYGDRIRIGGTMEFSGINSRLDRRRIDSIVAGATRSFQPFKSPEIQNEWAGMRPITVDGLPILDRGGDLDNTYVATGYAMQGVTLAPTAGRALAEMIATGKRPPLLEPFRLDRFGRLPLTRVVRRHSHPAVAGV
jgi:D-amino-acid dehydrogenase